MSGFRLGNFTRATRPLTAVPATSRSLSCAMATESCAMATDKALRTTTASSAGSTRFLTASSNQLPSLPPGSIIFLPGRPCSSRAPALPAQC